MSKAEDEAVNAMLRKAGIEGITVEGVAAGPSGSFSQVTLTIDRVIDDNLLRKAAQSGNEATTILLLSLEIEHQLSMLLSNVLNRKIGKQNFNTLCQMLLALRMPNQLFDIVDGFRKLRNIFAHEKHASLDNNKEIIEKIFRCEIPNLMDEPFPKKVNGIDFDEYSTISKLEIYANQIILFMAGTEKIFNFPTPTKRVLIRNNL